MLPTPAGARTIDFGDATLSPGFIDAHTHLSMMYSNDYRQSALDGLQETIPEQTLLATENLKKTLMVGVTTTRDVGSHDFMDVGLAQRRARGRHTRAAHAGLRCTPSDPPADIAIPPTGFRFGIFGRETGIEDGVIHGADQARQAVRFNVKYGADVIKTCATGGVLSLTDDVDSPQLTQAELNALVDEAHALRRKTAAHAHGAEGPSGPSGPVSIPSNTARSWTTKRWT